MSSTSSIENATSPLCRLEGALIVIKENLAIFSASEYSKVADLVKIYHVHNQKTSENLFNYLNKRSSKHSIDHILLGFSLEHGIGTIPNLRKAFLEFQKGANAKDSLGQFFLGRCYGNGIGTSQDQGKAYELYSKQQRRKIRLHKNLLEIVIFMHGEQQKIQKKHLNSIQKQQRREIQIHKTILHLAIKMNGKLQKIQKKHLNSIQKLQRRVIHLHNTILQFVMLMEKERQKIQKKHLNSIQKLQRRDIQMRNSILHFVMIMDWEQRKIRKKHLNSIQKVVNNSACFEAILDQLPDEFKCLKCGNSSIMFPSSTICLLCDANNILDADLPKCPECYSPSKDPFWCASCESSRFSKTWGTWTSGNSNVDQYIEYTQRVSESFRGCLEWISPDEIEILNEVGEGGFGVVKEGRWERGKILFWDKKNQKYERSGVTRVALKYLKNSQKMAYNNTIEIVAHLKCASCKYILQCYGITKDATSNEIAMVLPFAEHGDLKAFLKVKGHNISICLVINRLSNTDEKLRKDITPLGQHLYSAVDTLSIRELTWKDPLASQIINDDSELVERLPKNLKKAFMKPARQMKPTLYTEGQRNVWISYFAVYAL
ncbi:hypothetical protein G9A89_002672 [Geosiphon pyriformis]|nr:hypothetical protein G9A89_002672 [Geosiphon pyriformis]